MRRTGRRSDDCSAIPLPVLDRLVNGNHVDRKLAVRSRLVQPAEELARLDLGCESSRLEPPTRLPVIGVLDQPRDNRRLVVNRRSCVAICHGSDYAWRRTGLASSFAALRASLDRDTDLRVIEGYRLTGGRAAAVWERGVTLWDGDRDVMASFSSLHDAVTGMFCGGSRRKYLNWSDTAGG